VPIENNLGTNTGVVVVSSILLVLLGFSMVRSLETINIQRRESWGYTSKEWHNNQALHYWLEHRPNEEFLAFSNYPAGIAIYSWTETLASPRRVFSLEDFKTTLFEDGKTSYLIWIEPNTYTHVYDVNELRQIAIMETLYKGESGGVYKLLPLQ
jgi:hypothetical protein